MVFSFHDGLYFPFIREIETMSTTIVVVMDQYVIVLGKEKGNAAISFPSASMFHDIEG